MVKHKKKHIGYYVPLILFLLAGVALISQLSHDRSLQMITVIVISLFYTIWGIIHHMIHHDISTKIVVEYVLVSSLGMTILFFLIKGGLL